MRSGTIAHADVNEHVHPRSVFRGGLRRRANSAVDAARAFSPDAARAFSPHRYILRCVKWPSERRVEPAHAWGVVAVGTAGLVAIPTILATLHATDTHFRWWWPTNWMVLPAAIFLVGLGLTVLPVAPYARGPAKVGSTGASSARPSSSAAVANQRLAGHALIIEVSDDTYQVEVIRRSLTLPVLVEMWAGSSAPCRQLDHVLERLVIDSAGTWVLARVDVDANPGLMASLEVHRIPMVAAMIRGQIVDGFSGSLPEAELRRWIGRVIQIGRRLGL
jgi:thiol-disulfide isomerase/thioredoxin